LKIYCQVILSPTEKGDIITFYNNIFIPVMETILLHSQQKILQENKENDQMESSKSPLRVSANRNLHLSPLPLRSTTPNLTGVKYQFAIGSPGRNLQSINAALNSPRKSTGKPKQQLFKDDETPNKHLKP